MKNNYNNSKIYSTLHKLNIINKNNIEVFSRKTRDNNKLKVYRDKKSKVIFIDNFYIGMEEYQLGKYKNKLVPSLETTKRVYEDFTDSNRRIKKYFQFFADKDICDFGCGPGTFLKKAKPYAKSIYGIEPQEDLNLLINNSNIRCYKSLEKFNKKMDTFFLFHSFEHLPDPFKTLKVMRSKLKKNHNGKIVIEVPHAKDFLLDTLSLESFKNFTLWSQHLVLYTRESLNIILSEAGFKNIVIEGIQRYNLANHIHWLRYNKPSGHKEILSILENEEINTSYSNALSRIDANDTLIAIAST